MSSIFPLRDNVTLDDEREPRLVELDEETADEVFTALSSGTTRKIFLELHTAPQTASDLAEVTDTSVQNVQYHLEKLLDAELVEVVDTWYSERGSEMKVYAPQDESLVLFAGRDKQRSLRSLLRRIVGVLGVLVPGSALAGYATSRSGDGFGSLIGGGSSGDGNGGDGGYDTTANGADDGNANGADGGDPNGMANDTPEEEPAPETGNGEDEMADGDGMDDAEDGGNGGDAANGADGDAPTETPDTDVQTTADQVDNETVDFAVRTDGGQPDSTTDGAVDGVADGALDSVTDGAVSAADGAAGLDPALAAAVAFFFGGLFVFVGLTMWYGTPDTWT